MAKTYTVYDGKQILHLRAASEGGYVVTSPLDPELVTEADRIEEALDNAQDAARALKRSRAQLLKKLFHVEDVVRPGGGGDAVE